MNKLISKPSICKLLVRSCQALVFGKNHAYMGCMAWNENVDVVTFGTSQEDAIQKFSEKYKQYMTSINNEDSNILRLKDPNNKHPDLEDSVYFINYFSKDYLKHISTSISGRH